MRYTVPARLAHVVLESAGEDELTVFLMPLPDGPPVALKATAALIWLFASEGAEDVASVVAEHTDCSIDEIGDHVRSYLCDLVDRGQLIVRESPRKAPGP